MFHRILCAGVTAGLLAGIALTGLQSGAVTPLIAAAETYEIGANPGPHRHGELTHSHAFASAAHEHDGHAVTLTGNEGISAGSGAGQVHDRGGHDAASHRHGHAWTPGDGVERTAWTAVSNVATAIGFALLLGAIFAWRGGATWRQGLLWGAAGFVVFFANPAIGLHPEVPGAFAAKVLDRQFWWLFAVACSGAGVGLLLLVPGAAAKIGGAALLAVPHLIGAPHSDAAGGLAPRALADEFVTAAAITNGVFWLVLGLATAVAFSGFARR